MTALLTADEAARLVPGEQLVIVRPGDILGPVSYTHGAIVAPQDWVALTGPCPTCKGKHRVHVGPAPTVNYGHGYGTDCPDCRDGRRIVPLYAECGHKRDGGNSDTHTHASGHCCPFCCDGQRLAGRGSIEVVPVVELGEHGDPIPEGAWFAVALGHLIASSAANLSDGFDYDGPLPVPGRDFGIVIDCAEVNAEQYEKRKRP